jgi:hypothetical protein
MGYIIWANFLAQLSREHTGISSDRCQDETRLTEERLELKLHYFSSG